MVQRASKSPTSMRWTVQTTYKDGPLQIESQSNLVLMAHLEVLELPMLVDRDLGLLTPKIRLERL